ncbi:MAG: SDR family oxidoreductase [Verrucomicrobiota bacterium]
MSTRRAWITGAGGLIGNYLVRTAPRFAPGWEVRGIAREKLDLLDFAAVRAAYAAEQPELVIHCAAMSKSPACEANPEQARMANVDVTRVLAELAADARFIFFSTDLVFDGLKGNYLESDGPHPLLVYGKTKVEAERIVLANPRHTVIRTSMNGGVSPTGDRGFNEELRRNWQAGKSMTLFTDEFRCPLPAVVTARAVWELVARGAEGMFHLAGREKLSRWEMGKLVAARWPQLQPLIQPGSIKDFKGLPRSPDTSLNCAKVQQLLSFPLPGLGEWLAAHPDEAF